MRLVVAELKYKKMQFCDGFRYFPIALNKQSEDPELQSFGGVIFCILKVSDCAHSIRAKLPRPHTVTHTFPVVGHKSNITLHLSA